MCSLAKNTNQAIKNVSHISNQISSYSFIYPMSYTTAKQIPRSNIKKTEIRLLKFTKEDIKKTLVLDWLNSDAPEKTDDCYRKFFDVGLNYELLIDINADLARKTIENGSYNGTMYIGEQTFKHLLLGKEDPIVCEDEECFECGTKFQSRKANQVWLYDARDIHVLVDHDGKPEEGAEPHDRLTFKVTFSWIGDLCWKCLEVQGILDGARVNDIYVLSD